MTQLLDLLSRSAHQDTLANADIFIIPDFISITSMVSQVQGCSAVPIRVGAQDAFYEDSGPYTGAVSPAVLAEVGCSILELGHAERRRIFGETSEDIARKADAAVRNGLTPLICIGERTRCNASDVSGAVQECRLQIESVIATLPQNVEIVLAYEPVWAIGALQAAEPAYIISVVEKIRALSCVNGRDVPVRIIYGGSAGPGLFADLAEGVDGLFLGRFAHNPDAFYKTILEVATA